MLHCVRNAPPGPQVTDVYFINLPFVNIYAKPSLDRTLGPAFEPVRVHVLTYAPDPLVVVNDVIVEQRDDFTLRVTAIGRPFFERLLGRFLIDAFRQGGPFETGDFIPGRDFDVTIVDGSAAGVWSLDFTFARSLDDRTQAFYVSTPYEGAVPLRFASLTEQSVGWVEARRNPPIPSPDELGTMLRAGHAAAAEPLFDIAINDAAHEPAGGFRQTSTHPTTATAALADAQDAHAARETLHEVAAHVAGALAAPEHLLLAQESLSREDWEQVRRFWRERVDDQTLAEAFVLWETTWRLRWAMEEVPNARIWAGRVIHTDLYLTGRPFPGPRAKTRQ
jgi:hypothetical protein